jgi:DNA polymerase III subunit delta
MAKQAPTYYLFHGEDDYSIKAQIKKMRDQMGDDLNISDFSDPKVSPLEVLSAAQAMPFLSDKRLVIAHGLLDHWHRSGASKAQKELLKQFIAQLPDLPPTARLVFAESRTLPRRHPILKLLEDDPHGYVKEFNAPKNPTAWLKRQAEAYKIQLEPKAIAALVSVIGSDLRRADNELYKLAAFVGEGGSVREQDVALLTPYVPETNIFDLVDAIGKRNGRQAMQLLHRKLDIDEVDPFQIFGMVVRQFRLLLIAREVLDHGGGIGEFRELTGLHQYPAQKTREQARGFSLTALQHIYEKLLDLDVGVKTGKMDMATGLDMFVAGVTNSGQP